MSRYFCSQDEEPWWGCIGNGLLTGWQAHASDYSRRERLDMAEEVSEAHFSCPCSWSLIRRRQRYGLRLKRRERGMRRNRRRFLAIHEREHPTNDPERHTCAVFQMILSSLSRAIPIKIESISSTQRLTLHDLVYPFQCWCLLTLSS